LENKPSSNVWAHFLAASERILESLTSSQDGRVSIYRLNEVVPIRGQALNLKQGSSVARIETSVPPSLSKRLPIASSVIQFYGVTQHLHYTSDAQRRELDQRSISELEPSDHTTAVLIPIRKSEEWWKLSQDQRQAYFQTDTHQGHTAIGLMYVEQIFRKLYHSRYLGVVLGYDFLTYFEFEDVYKSNFRTLLSELRDTENNPEWVFVDREFEIWMTKIG
jgi:hypothetical protein